MKRVLIMGLPRSGKTHLADLLFQRLRDHVSVSWFNADQVREQFNDWDFSLDGRLRQASRMKQLAKESGSDLVICDFVAPLELMRVLFDPHYTIWVDTLSKSIYEDTNKIFFPPIQIDLHLTSWDYDVGQIALDMLAKLKL